MTEEHVSEHGDRRAHANAMQQMASHQQNRRASHELRGSCLLFLSFLLILVSFSPFSLHIAGARALIQRLRSISSGGDAVERPQARHDQPPAIAFPSTSRIEYLLYPFFLLGGGDHESETPYPNPTDKTAPRRTPALIFILMALYCVCAAGLAKFYDLCRFYATSETSFVLSVALFTSPYLVCSATCLPYALSTALTLCGFHSLLKTHYLRAGSSFALATIADVTFLFLAPMILLYTARASSLRASARIALPLVMAAFLSLCLLPDKQAHVFTYPATHQAMLGLSKAFPAYLADLIVSCPFVVLGFPVLVVAVRKRPIEATLGIIGFTCLFAAGIANAMGPARAALLPHGLIAVPFFIALGKDAAEYLDRIARGTWLIDALLLVGIYFAINGIAQGLVAAHKGPGVPGSSLILRLFSFPIRSHFFNQWPMLFVLCISGAVWAMSAGYRLFTSESRGATQSTASFAKGD